MTRGRLGLIKSRNQNNFFLMERKCNFCHLRRQVLDGSSLHLIDANLDDSGVYQCAAVNAHGMIISATWIHVAGNRQTRSMCK